MRYLGYALLLVLAGYVLTGLQQIRPGERAVVRRLGRVVAQPGPGLWVGLPWGLDRVDRVPIDRVRRLTLGYQPADEEAEATTPPGQLLTGDHNLVNVQVLLDYTVNADQVEDYVIQAAGVEGLLARAAEAALAEWIAARTVDEVLIRGKAELPAFLVGRTQQRLGPYRLGVVVQGASLAYLYPPDEVKPAFDEVNRAQTAIGTSEHVARQEAGRRLRQALAEKDRIEKLTAAYVTEQLSLAGAEAETFGRRLAQYRRLRRDNPSFLAGIWWEEIGKLLARLKANGRLDLLDNHLGGDGLDITLAPPLPDRK